MGGPSAAPVIKTLGGACPEATGLRCSLFTTGLDPRGDKFQQVWRASTDIIVTAAFPLIIGREAAEQQSGKHVQSSQFSRNTASLRQLGIFTGAGSADFIG